MVLTAHLLLGTQVQPEEAAVLGGAEQPGVQAGNVLHRPAELLRLPAQPTRQVGQQLQRKGCSDTQARQAGRRDKRRSGSVATLTVAAVTLLAALPDNRIAGQD